MTSVDAIKYNETLKASAPWNTWNTDSQPMEYNEHSKQGCFEIKLTPQARVLWNTMEHGSESDMESNSW
jgi:hypothetical protein